MCFGLTHHNCGVDSPHVNATTSYHRSRCNYCQILSWQPLAAFRSYLKSQSCRLVDHLLTAMMEYMKRDKEINRCNNFRRKMSKTNYNGSSFLRKPLANDKPLHHCITVSLHYLSISNIFHWAAPRFMSYRVCSFSQLFGHSFTAS